MGRRAGMRHLRYEDVTADLDPEPQAETKDFSSAPLWTSWGSNVFVKSFGPQLQDLLGQYSSLKTIAMQGIMGYGVVVSLHQLLGQSLMPTAYFRFEDQLYQHLCRFVLDKKTRGFTLAWPLGDKTNLVQSTIYRRSNITQEVWWPADHQGQKDVYYEKFGKRFFYHNGALFMLDIHPWHRRSSVPKDQAELRVLALTDKPIKALPQEVWDSRRFREGDVQTRVFTASTNDYDRAAWVLVGRKPIREMDTVDIKKDDQARLLEDAEKYVQEFTKA